MELLAILKYHMSSLINMSHYTTLQPYDQGEMDTLKHTSYVTVSDITSAMFHVNRNIWSMDQIGCSLY